MTTFRLRLLLVPFLACMAMLAAVLVLPTAASAHRPMVQANRPPIQRTGFQPVKAGIKDTSFIKMSIRDVVPLPEANTHAVVLISDKGDTILPVFVDDETALAVALRLAHKQSPAPMAADLLGGVIDQLGGKLVAVKLDSLVGNEYTGRVRVAKDGQDFEMAARPSDALAVALETGASVYASPDLLHDVGITRGQIEELRKHLPKGKAGDSDDEKGVGGSGPASKLPPGIEL
ncbi:MAG: bifunctional nuclease family protein [Myxococcaceae bacterium]